MLDDLDLAWEDQQEARRRGGPPSRQARQRRRKDRKRRRRSFGALFISFILLAVLGGGVYWGVGKAQEFFGTPDYEAKEQTTTEVLVKINSGDGGIEMGQELQTKGVVKSVKAFVAAYNDGDGESIQPGTYKLFEKMPAAAAVAALLDREKNLQVNTVTLQEGLSMIKTFAKLSEATGIPADEFKTAAEDPVALGIPEEWFARTDGKTAVRSVEGFLFPDTYHLDPTMTAEDILKHMVAQFMIVAEDIDLPGAASRLGLSPHEVLTVASLAQVEAGKAEDFAKVARVAYNRTVVEGGMIDCECLQFDVTANYGLEQAGQPEKASKDMTLADLDNPNNPWNTGPSTPGLPVGPISNPGKAAMEGAINPTPGEAWIYFVAVDQNGTTKFSSTDSQFCRDKNEAVRNGVLTVGC
jgi:UPF0755 protein